jgi:hypothetical protein
VTTSASVTPVILARAKMSAARASSARARAGWARSVDLRGQREGGRHPAGLVRREPAGRRVGVERRPVGQVPVLRAGQRVVLLRQPPQVVVAEEGAGLVPGADADLDVEPVAGRVPGLAQPVEPEPDLRVERRRRGAAHVPLGDEQQAVGVRRGVD